MDIHNQAVSHVALQVQRLHSQKEPIRIYHGLTNSSPKAPYKRDKMVDISGLKNVLKVDTRTKTVLVEPNVPMDALVIAALKHGLLPPVMEFPGLTVGGGFEGTAGESSSFRYGFFDRTINWIEMVLSDGKVVKASSKENAHLFYGASSALGTLGITTLLEVQLIDAKKYVKLTYYPVAGILEAQKLIRRISKDSCCEYLDGIMFSETYGVICAGQLTDDIENLRIQKFTRPGDPWFYIYVQRLMHNQVCQITEAVPIDDYLFRYDRAGLWVERYAYRYLLPPFNSITRNLLEYLMQYRLIYLVLRHSDLLEQHITHDIAIPYHSADKFVEYLAIPLKQFPIWLCPLKQCTRDTPPSRKLQVLKKNCKTPEKMLFRRLGSGSYQKTILSRESLCLEGRSCR